MLGSFDHPCAARGSGVLVEGQMLISCGTSWVGFYPVNNRQKAIREKMLVDTFLQPEGTWGAIFSLPAIATAVDKYICRYISDTRNRYYEFDRLSASANPGAGGLFINPLQEDETSKLCLSTRANIARAIMEGTAYLLKYQMEQLEKSDIQASSVVMAGGPSETFPWPQILCDILGMELSVYNGSCAGAVGAAILAGIGTGLYTDVNSAFSKTSIAKVTWIPDKAAVDVYKETYRAFKSRL
jgi:xylulokinase